MFLGSHLPLSHSLFLTTAVFGECIYTDTWWDIANENMSCEAHLWPPSCVTCTHLLPHLLLVFSLGVQTGLNAFSRLLEGLPLWAFCWVVCTHTYYVGAGEDQHVGHKLWNKARSLKTKKANVMETRLDSSAFLVMELFSYTSWSILFSNCYELFRNYNTDRKNACSY